MKIKFVFPQCPTKITNRYGLIWILCLNLSVGLQAGAATTSQERNWEQALIEGNISVSEWFDSFADGLDLFLVGKRVSKRSNETRMTIISSAAITEKEDLTQSFNFGLNLQLPNVEEYWHIKFSSYDELEDQRNLKNAYLQQTARTRNYGATIGLLATLGKVRTKFEPRIELQDPLRVSHSLSFDTVATSGNYELNPKLGFYANSDDGVGTLQALNFHIQLSQKLSLTFINQGDYQEKTHLYRVDNGVSYGQVLNRQSSLSYNLLFSSTNLPNYHLESYNISTAYNIVLYRKILELQFIPNVDFAEMYDFHGVAGLTFNINLQF